MVHKNDVHNLIDKSKISLKKKTIDLEDESWSKFEDGYHKNNKNSGLSCDSKF